MSLATDLTQLFGIKHPIMLAGMNVAAGPELAAAVTNAGGIGVIGGVGYSPEYLRSQIAELKEYLNDKNAPFGIDLLLPQVGGENARKTNKDYTGGKLKELVDIVIAEKAALFVAAVGVPPKEVVDRLHAAGIPVMNMCGNVRHAEKALAVGCDLICAQGSEAGGHSGKISTALLLPACVAAVKGKVSPLTGKPIQVIAAGGIYNGAGLAAALSYGASGVWVGTRFVCAEEAGASRGHQQAVVTAGFDDTVQTLIFTGRPLRIRKTDFVMDWENNRQEEMQKMLAAGKLPVGMDSNERPYLMGQTSAMINDVLPAKTIVDNMISEAVDIINVNSRYVSSRL